MIREDLNLYKDDRKYLILIFILSALCFIKMLQFARSGAILNVDSTIYSITAMGYAGVDYYNILNPKDVYYTPVVSFLTSLLFRMGYVSRFAIVIVSMLMSFSGYFGLYILFKNRFNGLLSFMGVVIFGCLSVVLMDLPMGMIDIPCVAVSIWVLVFAVAAIDKNPKYFILTSILFVIAFFTKYVAGFMLPIILLYYLIRRDFVGTIDEIISDHNQFKVILVDYLKSKEFKYIIISLFIGIVLTAIICKTLILDFGGGLGFISKSSSTLSPTKITTNRIYNPDKLFYLRDFPNIFFKSRNHLRLPVTFAFCALIAIGLVINSINIIKNRQFIFSKKDSFKTKHIDKLLILLFIILLGLSGYAFKFTSNHMLSNISLLAAITVLYPILEKYNVHENKLSFDLMMFAYFCVFFIFLSIYTLKVRRYALPFIPPFIYFVIWGLNSLLNLISNGFDDVKSFKEDLLNTDNDKRYKKLANAIPILCILALLLSTAYFLAPLEIEEGNYEIPAIHYQGYVNDLMDVCDFVKENDSDYHSKSFASFSATSRPIKWYLQTNVSVINGNDKDIREYDNATYLILNRHMKFDNYHVYHDGGDFLLYKHN